MRQWKEHSSASGGTWVLVSARPHANCVLGHISFSEPQASHLYKNGVFRGTFRVCFFTLIMWNIGVS